MVFSLLLPVLISSFFLGSIEKRYHKTFTPKEKDHNHSGCHSQQIRSLQSKISTAVDGQGEHLVLVCRHQDVILHLPGKAVFFFDGGVGETGVTLGRMDLCSGFQRGGRCSRCTYSALSGLLLANRLKLSSERLERTYTNHTFYLSPCLKPSALVLAYFVRNFTSDFIIVQI
jgi:hypothetical protein